MIIPRIPKVSNAVLTDNAVAQIQDALSELDYLNHIFGRAQKLVRKKETRLQHFPGVVRDTGEYMDMTPVDTYGNYSFITFEDPQKVDISSNRYGHISAKGSVIVWFNLLNVGKSKEAIKSDILDTLSRKLHLKNGHLSVREIYETHERIFSDYDYDETVSQYLMHPYGGFKFTFDLIVTESC